MFKVDSRLKLEPWTLNPQSTRANLEPSTLSRRLVANRSPSTLLGKSLPLNLKLSTLTAELTLTRRLKPNPETLDPSRKILNPKP